MQRTFVVTGASRGIGWEITRYFCDQGDYVVIGSREAPRELAKLGDHACYVPCDVRKRTDHFNLVKQALSWRGELYGYINCAGVSQWRPLQDVDEDFWNLLIETNLTGAFWGAQAARENLAGGGIILNISSLAGKRGSANNAVYCASKFGLNGITQALAKELGPQQIRVNAVCPVYVTTASILESLEDPRSPALGQPVEKYLNQFTQSQCALQRLPTAQEVAAACYFLASDAASAITGQCINVDCGVLPQ